MKKHATVQIQSKRRLCGPYPWPGGGVSAPLAYKSGSILEAATNPLYAISPYDLGINRGTLDGVLNPTMRLFDGTQTKSFGESDLSTGSTGNIAVWASSPAVEIRYTTLYDQSFNGNDAIQTTAGARPYYRGGGGVSPYVNAKGKNAVWTDAYSSFGSYSFITGSSIASLINGKTVTVFIVSEPRNGSASNRGMIYSSNSGSVRFEYNIATPGIKVGTNGTYYSSTTGWNTGTGYLGMFLLTPVNGNGAVWKNDVVVATSQNMGTNSNWASSDAILRYQGPAGSSLFFSTMMIFEGDETGNTTLRNLIKTKFGF